jgi:tRNA A-37 threonylcarbamoyl transferase component Bud32
LGIVNIPKIYSYDKKNKILKMQRIPNMNISDKYGEESSNISKELFNKIRKVVKKLYLNNIEYSDITGYNFIEYQGKIWVIDFGHAYFNLNITNPFIKKFLKGLNSWNDEYA